jgi:hypothetical protein
MEPGKYFACSRVKMRTLLERGKSSPKIATDLSPNRKLEIHMDGGQRSEYQSRRIMKPSTAVTIRVSIWFL